MLSGFKIFFHRDAAYFKETGKLLVSSRKHGLKKEIIRFVIIEPFHIADLNETIIQAIFLKAKEAGFKPHSLVSYLSHEFPTIVPDKSEHRKKLTLIDLLSYNEKPQGDLLDPDYYAITCYVKSGECTVVKHILRVDASYDLAVTPDLVTKVFNLIRDEGHIPVSMGEIASSINSDPVAGFDATDEQLGYDANDLGVRLATGPKKDNKIDTDRVIDIPSIIRTRKDIVGTGS